MSRITSNINPEFLKWARKESGFEIIEIASKLKISEANYIQWEENGLRVPLGKLKSLANSYKRQIAAFFLPYVPESRSKPKDFRNLSLGDSKLSKSLLLTLRRVNQIQDASINIKGSDFWEGKYKWLYELEDLDFNNEQTVLQNWLRRKLELSIDQQSSFPDSRRLYNSFRKQIEGQLGILVLQFSMPMNEAHGFSQIDKKPFVIVTNSKHTYNGRVFTLFHELAHILNHQSGICLIDHSNTSNQIEFSCNKFAGDFLIPDEQVFQVATLNQILKYSNKYNVSREAYLRRVKDKGIITNALFFDLLDEIKESYSKIKPPGGFAPPELKSKASRGPTFFNMVIDGINANQINYADASQLLDLKINRILNEL